MTLGLYFDFGHNWTSQNVWWLFLEDKPNWFTLLWAVSLGYLSLCLGVRPNSQTQNDSCHNSVWTVPQSALSACCCENKSHSSVKEFSGSKAIIGQLNQTAHFLIGWKSRNVLLILWNVCFVDVTCIAVDFRLGSVLYPHAIPPCVALAGS